MKNQIIITIFALLLVAGMTGITALDLKNIQSAPSEVKPGEQVKISMNIENNFDTAVQNVRVSLDLRDLPFAPSSSGVDRTFDEINDNNEKSISFNLEALPDAKAGVYKIPVIIGYTLNDIEKQDSSLISLTITSLPELRVEYEDSLIKGQENKLTIKIVNSGLGDAKFLIVNINNAPGIRVIGSSSAYIGDIDSDDFQSADFSIFIDSSAAKTISLPITIEYKDSSNKNQFQDENIILTAYTQQEAIQLGLIPKSNTGAYVSIAVLLILVYIVYRIFKARKKRNKLKQTGR
ncbi:MAG: hypothetical protein ABIH72_01430 [archaeon]